MMRAVALALAAGVASAQLLMQDPVPPEELRAMVEGYAREHLAASEPSDELQSPSLCDSDVKQYSGYLPSAADSKYFFWMFESRNSPSKDPVILWLTGGPGCSSQLALLTENGPCSVKGTSTQKNPYSWTEKANVIWVDQPAATGFSTGTPFTHGEDDVQQAMHTFLLNLYEKLPQFKNNDFYIFGESYAGHYVPAISHYIWEQNQKDGVQIPLKGIAIGNGLTDPEEQYKWYPEMAKDGGKAEGGSAAQGVITNIFGQGLMKAAVGPCTSRIHGCNSNTSSDCTSAYTTCNMGELVPYQVTGMNPYDMTKKCAVKPLCYDFSAETTWLNDAETQKQLGVGKKWESCNMVVNQAFQGDYMKNYHTKIPDLLAGGVRVLIYAGDYDYICNWLGNKHWTLALDWPHKADFNAAADEPYMVSGKEAGRLRGSNGFHFMQVFRAGHMVPMDQPEAALQMVNDFTSGKIGAVAASLVV